jgi:hypothetical protein
VLGGEQSVIVHVGTLRLLVLAVSYCNWVCLGPGVLRAGCLGNLSFAKVIVVIVLIHMVNRMVHVTDCSAYMHWDRVFLELLVHAMGYKLR